MIVNRVNKRAADGVLVCGRVECHFTVMLL